MGQGIHTVFYIIQILCFGGGVAGLSLSFLMYLKYRNQKILLYTWALFFWMINFGTLQILLPFMEGGPAMGWRFQNFIDVICFSSWALMTLFLIGAIHLFSRKKLPAFQRWGIYLSCFYIGLPLGTFLPRNGTYLILNLAQLILHYLLILHVAHALRSAPQEEIPPKGRKALKCINFTLRFFYPLVIVDISPLLRERFHHGIGLYGLFFLGLNITVLYLISQYIHIPELRPQRWKQSKKNIYGFSARELEIIALILKGKTYRDTAEVLYVSPETIKSHMTNIYRKAGVSSKIQLKEKLQRESPESHGENSLK